MDHSIIVKYLKGQTSEQEVKEVFEWIDSSPENKTEFIQIKRAWALTAHATEDQDKVWNREIRANVFKKSKITLVINIVKYAAVIFIFFFLGMYLQNELVGDQLKQQVYIAETTIEVPLGQMSNVRLPDGTTVQLNSGSNLKYSGDFSSGERMVSLEGEAYFDVAKDKSHPFVINTPFLDFKVYGTSFNIQAYSDETEINTTLVEGSLGILGKSGKEYLKLSPGENANYDKETKEIKVGEVNLDMYTSWKEGMINFRNEKLQDVALKMERWYNVEIRISNQQLANELYFGTIMKNKPIDQILEVFKMTSSLNYRIVPRAGEPTLIYWE
jgi:ferric-dicitrate binding protein FerR (iron transport regulator)